MEDFSEVIAQPEGKTLEFKLIFPPDPKNLLKTCIAFSNGAGGKIFIGVSDKERKVKGVEAAAIFDMEEKLANLIYTGVEPAINFDFTTLNIEGKTLVRIVVPPGGLKPYYLKSAGIEKGTFIRVGSTNRLATPDILAELRRQRRNVGYDSDVLPGIRDDILEPELLKDYYKLRSIEPPANKSLKACWEKIGAIHHANGSSYPKVGAILLFGKYLPESLSQATIQITRFKGIDMEEIIDTQMLYPPLFYQIETAIKFLKLYIGKNINIRGARREERYLYPMDALREAVINAVCHRDYSIMGANVKIAIFDDRIEFTNPGALPGGLLLEDIGKGISELRNRYIAKILRECGYIEQLGMGINKIYASCRKYGIPQPLFQELGLFFKVTFYKNFSGIGLDNDEAKILDIADNSDHVTPREISSALQIHKNTATNKLKRLVEKGRLFRTGKGRSVAYVKK